MAESLIKWKKGDFIKLGKAVSEFNKKRNKLINEENENYFPDEIEYKEAKNNIKTRKEFNRYVNMLKRFQQEDATELYETQVGEQMTKWTRRELTNMSRIITARTNREIAELNKPLEGSNYSRAQMGSSELRVAQAKLIKLRQIEMKEGYQFKKLKNFILFQGSSDFYTKRAIVYQRNYMEELKKYQNYDNYDKLMKKLNSIKNPNEFYELMSNTGNELDKDLTRQSDQVLMQAEFNLFVQRILGEELDENDRLLNEFEMFKYEMEKGNEILF